jgi:CheY-like chemotaxis protein
MNKVPHGSIGNEIENECAGHNICINCNGNATEDHFINNMNTGICSKRILVIDDDPVLVKLVSEMLDILGYKSVTSTSSIEGFRLFCDAPDDFDLVITDMSMPEMNGDILAGRIISIRNNIPIILCTGFNENVSDEEAKSIGICEIVLKPVNMKTLSEVVIKAITNRQV